MQIYTWVDEVPLSRPKRNITRDFSDGVLMAEVVHHFFPRDVDVKNYSAANSVRQKLYNWQTLIHKVRSRRAIVGGALPGAAPPPLPTLSKRRRGPPPRSLTRSRRSRTPPPHSRAHAPQVFRKIAFPVEKSEVDAIVACKPGAIESLLLRLQDFIAMHRQRISEAGGVEWAHAAGAGGGGGGGGGGGVYAGAGGARQQSVGAPSAEEAARAAADAELLAEKDKEIAELTEHVEILELKVKKLEQLVRLKDSRIATLSSRVSGAQP